MRVVALVSGGKDSCYNMMQCVAAGHEIVALANLQPLENDELDSYMYQTVGHDGISLYSEAMGLPLFRHYIKGNALVQDKFYSATEGDEVEDLFLLLSDIKSSLEFDAISVGAILSDYQRIRVENVCARIGCICLAYLWRRNQTELLQEMIDSKINAIIIKTASLGLHPDIHLGQTISEIQKHLLQSKEKYGINVCGEGGEYETFTLDCPLFRQSIILDEFEKVIHSNDAFAPVGYLKFNKMHLVNKNLIIDDSSFLQQDLLKNLPMKSPLEYLCDFIECKKIECCDGQLANDNEENNGECEANKLLEEGAQIGELNNIISAIDNNSKNSEPENKTKPEKNSLMVNLPLCRETSPFPTSLKIVSNCEGWTWILGIIGNEETNPMKNALLNLQSALDSKGLSLDNLICVIIYITNMSDYAQYNQEYIKFFTSKPPVRICVELSLPQNIPILLEGVAFLSPEDNCENSVRNCMHVQSISCWAPANIGPYSQAIWVGGIIYIAGQIGLVPGTLKLVDKGYIMECKLALRHINRILKAVDSKLELRDVVQGICYVTNAKYIDECRKEWEKRSNNAIVEYLVVTRLPRDSSVEWQVWAHRENASFKYEETGCFIGSKVKVRLIRRWNYENRVSAIVCQASLCEEATSFLNKEEMNELAEYALNKLLSEAEKFFECSLRVFYRVGAIDPLEIHDTLEELNKNNKYSFSFTILPVASLIDENTFISFFGKRH